MRSKKFVIVYAIIILLVVFLITFNSVCAIRQFDVRFDVASRQAKAQSAAIQEELDTYLKKNFMFFDVKKIDEIFAREENSHLKILSVKKNFPNRITVHVCEMYESYAFYDEESEKYYVTDDAGEIIAIKDDFSNNLSGNNIKIEGFSIQPAAIGQKLTVAEKQTEYYNGVRRALSSFENSLDGVRTNIVSVRFNSKGMNAAFFQMQEGVVCYFISSALKSGSEELFGEVCSRYRALSDSEKTYGRISVVVMDNGEGVVQDWDPKEGDDVFDAPIGS